MMRISRRSSQKQRNQAGFTLIELMIAGALLVFGILTMAGLVGLTVKNNGHSRLDSTATMLNQAVVEQLINGINNKEIAGATSATIADCNGGAGSTNWTIDSDGPGAPLDSKGNIDFTASQSSGYYMNYVVCNADRRVVYDVRWNITPLTGTAYTSVLTVGSRIQGGPAIINFPINMRVMVGPDPRSGTPGL
jgi:type II secretory pathway pseudopilin PulG